MKTYERVLVKLSGAAVAGGSGFGFDNDSLSGIVDELLALVERGVQTGVVIGGGNIMRGSAAAYWGIDRVEADNIGMLGTVINSLMLRGALKSRVTGARQVRVMTSVPIPAVAEPFIRFPRALKQRPHRHFCGRQRPTLRHHGLPFGAACPGDRL